MKITHVQIGYGVPNGRDPPFILTLKLEGAPVPQISVVGRDFEDMLRRLHCIPAIRESHLIREIMCLELQRYAAMITKTSTEFFRTTDLDLVI